MNIEGGYIHKNLHKIHSFPTFQVGALASQLPSLCWEKIALAKLELCNSNEIEDQITFDNSIRGLPFKEREVVVEEFDSLYIHQWDELEKPSIENIEMIFLVADTQDDRSVVGVFAYDVNDNLYLIEAKELQYLFITESERKIENEKRLANNLPPIETVEDMLNRSYLNKNDIGITPTFCLIDRRRSQS